MAKYELTKRTLKTASGKTLYRIQAVQNIYHNKRLVTKGEMGGYVESPANLSQEGKAWISDNAMVMGKTIVEGSAWISDSAVVSGQSVITDSAEVSGSSFVESSTLSDTCKVKDRAIVKDSTLHDLVLVQDKAYVEKSSLDGTVNIMDESRIFASTVKGENIIVREKANVDMSNIGGISTYDTPKTVVIGGESSLMRTRIFGKNVVVSGSAKLGKGALLIGEEIRILDYSDIAGNVEILSDVTVSEMAFIRNESHMPLHLDKTEINGDTVIEKK